MVITFCLLLLGSGVFSFPDVQYVIHATPVSSDAWSLVATREGIPALGVASGSRVALFEAYPVPALLGPQVRTQTVVLDLETQSGVMVTAHGWQIAVRPEVIPCP